MPYTTSGGSNLAVSHHNDTIAVYGHDTINSAVGHDTIYQLGQATVFGSFAPAHADPGHGSGNTTMLGGASPTEFVGGLGQHSILGGFSPASFTAPGQDSAIGGAGSNVFEFLSGQHDGQHVITNFVSGQDKLYLEGYSLSYLQQHGEINSHGGNTYISLDSGKTTIELKGVSSLHSSDITTHKP
jgi:hypothetical protein